MKPKILFYIYVQVIFMLFTITTKAQKYKSISSSVHFYSDAPVEDIEATNKDGQSAFNIENGEIVFSVPIKSFEFEKSLMQEHFNENYLESDKYPNATFIGTITDYDNKSTAWQDAKARGKMKIHGVERDMVAEGRIKIDENTLEINAKFPIKLEDYKIKIPKVVFYNIAEIVDVTVTFNYEKIN